LRSMMQNPENLYRICKIRVPAGQPHRIKEVKAFFVSEPRRATNGLIPRARYGLE